MILLTTKQENLSNSDKRGAKMNVSFGKIYKANVYNSDNTRVTNPQVEKQALTMLAHNLSAYKDPDSYGNLVKQQRILTRMQDRDYQIPTSPKTANENNSSTVSPMLLPDEGRYIVIGKRDNDAIADIRHQTIGVPYYNEGRDMQELYTRNFKNAILSYFKANQRLSDHELNVQIKKNSKGEMYVSLINFKKPNSSKA